MCANLLDELVQVLQVGDASSENLGRLGGLRLAQGIEQTGLGAAVFRPGWRL